MERNVVTLETAQKLEAAGFPQKTLYLMRHHKPNGATDIRPRDFQLYENEVFRATNRAEVQKRFDEENEFLAAPTAQEIADQLPNMIGKFWLRITPYTEITGQTLAEYMRFTGEKGVYQDASIDLSAHGDTMAEALALLWLRVDRGDADGN